MITLWGRKNSSNVQTVIWCLEELNLSYDRKDAGFTYGVVDTDAYGAMNPNRTVPTLQDGDNQPLFESCAIVRYLANRYASGPFWPEDIHARAQVDMWAEWSKLNIANAISIPLFWPIVRLDPATRDDKAIAASLKSLSAKLSIADKQLSNQDYLAGNDFTLADIVFGHLLYRYYDIDLDRPDHPNVYRYYERLTERPAYRNFVMVSYEALRFKSA